jgi:hypothetical protein
VYSLPNELDPCPVTSSRDHILFMFLPLSECHSRNDKDYFLFCTIIDFSIHRTKLS